MDAPLVVPVTELDTVVPRLEVCARHGAPATRRVNFVLQSRPKQAGDGYGRLVKVSRVSGWPFCGRCLLVRRLWSTLAAVLFLGGGLTVAAVVVYQLVTWHPSAILGLPVYIGLAAVLLSPGPFVLGGAPRIVNARASADGYSMVVRDPHQRFAQQV